MKVDVLQCFISTAAIIGIGVLMINFNEKVFRTVRDLMKAPLTNPDSDEEESD